MLLYTLTPENLRNDWNKLIRQSQEIEKTLEENFGENDEWVISGYCRLFRVTGKMHQQWLESENVSGYHILNDDEILFKKIVYYFHSTPTVE